MEKSDHKVHSVVGDIKNDYDFGQEPLTYVPWV